MGSKGSNDGDQTSSPLRTPSAMGGSLTQGRSATEATGLTKSEETMRVFGMSDSLERLSVWADLIRNADEAELKEIGAAALAWYRAGGEVDHEGDLLQFREGQMFGSGMFKDLTEDPNGFVSLTKGRHMRGWASASPAEARAWLEELSDGSVKDGLRTAWYEGAVAENPEIAGELFASLPDANKHAGLDMLFKSLHKLGGMDSVVDWFAETASAGGDSSIPLQPAFDKLAWRLGNLSGSDLG